MRMYLWLEILKTNDRLTFSELLCCISPVCAQLLYALSHSFSLSRKGVICISVLWICWSIILSFTCTKWHFYLPVPTSFHMLFNLFSTWNPLDFHPPALNADPSIICKYHSCCLTTSDTSPLSYISHGNDFNVVLQQTYGNAQEMWSGWTGRREPGGEKQNKRLREVMGFRQGYNRKSVQEVMLQRRICVESRSLYIIF